MALSASDTAVYTTRLSEAQDALHKLMTGQTVRVFVDQNGERIEYNAANADRLRAYIFELKQALGKLDITGPLTPWF